ncbi:MAG: GMC family oxidoreductase N-terminal domain-containing protein, partial [Chloroflexia bacterium]|nr:GMC family oxidoreductase N-terminal domain-containing protein [Chloroflexia bacterium]
MIDGAETSLPRAAGTIVVGAGPAGAVLAARLAEAGEDILLLEAGPDYGPPGSGRWPERLLDPTLMPVEEHSWGYISACQHGTPDMALQRARVIGGCSAHNGCAAVWGHRSDYDTWAVENPGWSAADVEPLFREVDTRLRVHIPAREDLTPFHHAVLDAAANAGYPFIPDLSSLDPEFGFAIGPVNIDPTTRVRWNASFAYLDPIRDLPNLRIAGDTLVDKVTLSGGRITGLEVITRLVTNAPHESAIPPAVPPSPIAMGLGAEEGGRRVRAHIATERVILAAGAYGSPLILLRSGIGAADELRAAGIDTMHDLPGVGRNLQDHPAIGVHYEARPETIAALEAFIAAGGLPREEGTIGLARSSRCEGPYDLHLYPVASHPFAGKGWRFHISGAVMCPVRAAPSISTRMPPATPRPP